MYYNRPDGIYFDDEHLTLKGEQSEEEVDNFVGALNKRYLEAQKKNTSE